MMTKREVYATLRKLKASGYAKWLIRRDPDGRIWLMDCMKNARFISARDAGRSPVLESRWVADRGPWQLAGRTEDSWDAWDSWDTWQVTLVTLAPGRSVFAVMFGTRREVRR